MKFWQRAYLSILLLFLFCFYVSIYMVSNFAYRTSMNVERGSAFREAGFIAASVERDMFDIMNKSGDISADGYSFFLRYANYYENRDIYLELWKNDTYLTGNIPGSPLKEYKTEQGEQISIVVEYNQKKYSVVAGSFICYPDSYTLIYAHDLQVFTDEHNLLSEFLLISGVAFTAILATGLYFLLRRLSKPIENLDEATGRISDGDYSMRLPVKGKDEFAALAGHFNNMANEIETKIHELQATSEQKQRFIDNLAHELRTPLTTIRGYAEYLKNANINDDDKIASIDHIIAESARIAEMTNKLLDLALLRNNALETINIDLPELFNAVIGKMRHKTSECNVELEMICEINSIIGDKILIESMLCNLLDNAIKASMSGGIVKLSGLKENGHCSVVIQDFGKGMPEELLGKLTEPFYRVDKARSRSEGGAGLGLALCEQIAELHKAKLTFSSEVDKGTTVRITFTTP